MDISTMLVAVTVILLVYLFHKYFIKVYDYWPKRGVPCFEGALPFIGNNLPLYLFRKDFPDLCEDIYKSHPNRSMVGFYQNRSPSLLVRDPELVKTVLISSFANFHVNFLSVDPESDPLLALNPFFVNGDEWKKRRNYISSALMSSKKLKVFCATITKVCAKFTKYLDDQTKRSNGVYEVDAKDLFTRFTGEVVSNVGFGVEGEFFADRSDPNSFKSMVGGIFEPTLMNNITFALIFMFPTLNKLLRRSFIPKPVDRLFRGITNQVIASRRNDSSAARNDFIQLMLEAHTEKDGQIDRVGLTASATSFFMDGYETSAVTLLFFAYHLAVNQPVQDRVRREVIGVLEKHDGLVSYDSIAEMTYMDQALSESMRLIPAFGVLVKRCNERCKLVGEDGIECVVEPGTDVVLPSEFLQVDPKYWDKPEVYDPERFIDDSKNDRPKTVFLPFGEGPRICVGKRFATMQMKAAMATLLRRFSIELSPKTKLPLEFRTAPLKMVVGGLWIKIKPL